MRYGTAFFIISSIYLSSMLCSAWSFRHGRAALSILGKLKSMHTKVKVSTYNVLSSSLSDPGYFTACSPEHLDPPTRLDKVRKKLQIEMDAGSIICLQEVSDLWSGDLNSFFSQHGYHLITGSYGSAFDGYMGAALAIPLNKYILEHCDVQRVADTKSVLEKRFDRKPAGFIPETIDKVVRTWKSIVAIWSGKRSKPTEGLWDMVKKRFNKMICAKLKCVETNKCFVVGTYHMPCAFRNPDVMVVHAALSAQHIQKYAEGMPHIFVGDFNFKPDSAPYSLLTDGYLSSNHSEYPVMQEGDMWTPSLETPLRSAYNTSLGSEPDFTNYAKIASEPPFIETLDYIFYSPDWTVESVKPLPHRDSVVGPLPNEEEPSDHILLSASLSLQEKN